MQSQKTEEEDEKITCGKCDQQCIKILTHLSKKKECIANLNITNLKISLDRFKHQKRQRKYAEKLKVENQDEFKENQRQRKRMCDKKAKEEDQEIFQLNQRQRQKKCDKKAKDEDRE